MPDDQPTDDKGRFAQKYDDAARADILSRVYEAMCEGRSVCDIVANEPGMPARSTLNQWLVEDEANARYVRAKAVRADLFFEKVVATAEDDEMKPDDKRVRIDAYKWAAAKLYGKYSEKVKHVGGDEGDNPITVTGIDLRIIDPA